jgi:hypothetical protein
MSGRARVGLLLLERFAKEPIVTALKKIMPALRNVSLTRISDARD